MYTICKTDKHVEKEVPNEKKSKRIFHGSNSADHAVYDSVV